MKQAQKHLVFVCVCYLLLFRHVGRLRSITLLIFFSFCFFGRSGAEGKIFSTKNSRVSLFRIQEHLSASEIIAIELP